MAERLNGHHKTHTQTHTLGHITQSINFKGRQSVVGFSGQIVTGQVVDEDDSHMTMGTRRSYEYMFIYIGHIYISMLYKFVFGQHLH